MSFEPLKRPGVQLSSGEFLALHDVMGEAAEGRYKVGGVLSQFFYRWIANSHKQNMDTILDADPLDDTVISTKITMFHNTISSSALRKTVGAAIEYHSANSAQVETQVSYAEDLNILRGLATALEHSE